MTTTSRSWTALFLGISLGSLPAANWSQYRGPNSDGSSPEKIRTNWAAAALQPVWKTPMPNGFSAITFGGGEVFTLVTAEVDGAEQEVCEALDAATGKQLWTAPLGIAKYDGGGGAGAPGNNGGDGPRSTPSYDDGKVYVYSARMVLKCFDAKSGRQIWACDLIKEHAGRNIHWESAASPLVEGELVYVAGGGIGEALLAFDKKDGHVVWKGQDDGMTQSTPTAATILGQRQIIFFTQTGLVAVEPRTGAVLWRYPFPYRTSSAISPVVSGDIVYCANAYGVGSSACRIARKDGQFTAEKLWMNSGDKAGNHWSTPVCRDGFLYGIFDKAKFGSAPLECVELATGHVRWTQPGFGPGGCTLVNGSILVLTDAGDLVLIKATPEAYTEISRTHVLAGKCWNVPTISEGRIYARSTREGVSLDAAP
ncbi:MAG TPA: PQQ-binding-like beta-propeller repeat protein [Verrucomicrobiae bacterium]|jgi:outer membrane protein assembly factor BamB|nr:PQQ-binding-like beta-propeller repeat protein [Verrucomicrobiae bacterium]